MEENTTQKRSIVVIGGACPVKCELCSLTKALLSYFTGRTGIRITVS